ncbi:MAG: transcriptional regulator NrdR [Casimicrobiaceae bacterium]|nr:transcriptional regulator NrdR [Casimicrobiaceae bacterium]MCX8099170.1 transcriptional regulator NrdR [Casimicrobiaceae bacterium]MDW8312609.1 transcriptional regulator NrdR [Burkholderiales bacterium]
MKCPYCGWSETQVVDSRVSESGDAIRRRRRCGQCGKRFTTFETVEMRLPQVVKQNGTRVDFSIEKIRAGFNKALHKRFVPTEYVDQAISRIVAQIHARGEREISSREIGEMVMAELYKLDKVGYIRFASVYRAFSDVEDFRSMLHEVDQRSTGRKRGRSPSRKGG